MKPLLLTIALLFSTPSWAEWELVSMSYRGDEFLVDFDRIRKSDGYIYYWELTNYKEPTFGNLSHLRLIKCDCDLLRNQIVSHRSYKKPFGVEAAGVSVAPPQEWNYAPPNSPEEYIILRVCNKQEFKNNPPSRN